MQLSLPKNIGHYITFGLLAVVFIFGLTVGPMDDDPKADNRKMGLGAPAKIQQRFGEQRNFIRYTANQDGLTLPSVNNTVQLCRRFRVTQAALLNANGQRNANTLQPDSVGQIRIPL